jgi:uncharacterized protein YaiI (UPF0178 family)
MTEIYVDADGCPVKDETYRVAKRHALVVHVVANAWIATPADESIRLAKVSGGFDAADDWIAERAGPGDVVVTGDIPLAARCLKKGAAVIGTTGKPFTADSIGGALASRELFAHLRESGAVTRGPAPFGKKDRSRFLEALEHAIQAAKRRR